MIKESEKIIMIKTAITLRVLLNLNKSSLIASNKEDEIVSSYEKISTHSNSDLTKATVNNAFSGVKRSTMPTIIMIVETMGFTMQDFGEQYSKVKDEHILAFRQNIMKQKF
ncbi:hypothetical protein DSC47_00750 [Elizabethkingia miricola]|nr:hypothetical protein DSC47_00750 [Elizabethkingia miricola]